MTANHPSHIGKYAISATLGTGAMGVVYKGHDENIDRTVAIKTIRKAAFSADELTEALGRFKREAQAAGRLLHNNIVTVYEYGEEEETAFIAMEFAQGHTLKKLLQAGRGFSVRVIKNISRQLLTGLQYAHDHGVIHRDIKPENILICREGRIKIMDFGIARVESSSLTSAGTFMGTPAYMAPELFADQEADARTDIFAVGVVLYQLFTGSKPFRGSSMTAIMHQVIYEEPPPPSRLSSTISPEVDKVLRTALAKDPAQRYASAKELRRAIQAALADMDDSVVLGRTGQQTEADMEPTIYQSADQGHALRSWWSRLARWQQGALVVLGLAIAGLLGWGLFHPPPQPAAKTASSIPVIDSTAAKKRVTPPSDAPPAPTKPVVLAPASVKKRISRAPSSPGYNGQIAITSSPYQPEQPPVSHGIRITTPRQ